MFLLPFGALCGADIGAAAMAGNLIPVAAGNAVGAALLVGKLQKLSVLGRLGR